ncbi:hypothetical protein CJ030_MR3G001131 [Morella rubra]|uniref:Uncharacterized protein n=1 Tax=Morella rubra TaxID=262757 RepID=A0A6A1W4Z7_9ROSI|nr:hypothetical protein CJ030_MR3G001131 [Morella rubra]
MEGHLLTQHPCSIFTHPRPPPLSQPPYRDAKPINPNLSSLFRCSFSTRYRPRDSNAETVGSSQKFSSKDEDVEDQDSEFGFGRSRGRNKKRRWWSDDNSSSPEMEEGPAGIFEQAIDTFWILKVFRSYGWVLPAIIVSLLLSTGPKAFLMALALPLGQSALSLAFEKLWGRTQRRPKQKSRMRRKPSASTTEKEDQDESQETREGKVGYQSWVVGNNGSIPNGGRDTQNLGGWDDLVRSGSPRRASRMSAGSQKTPTRKGKLSRRDRKRCYSDSYQATLTRERGLDWFWPSSTEIESLFSGQLVLTGPFCFPVQSVKPGLRKQNSWEPTCIMEILVMMFDDELGQIRPLLCDDGAVSEGVSCIATG